MTLLLMGSAEALPQEPATKPVFMEDMSEQQLASAVSTLNSYILLLTLCLTKLISSPSVSLCYLLTLCFSVVSPSVSLCYLLTLCFSVLSSHPLFLCGIFSPSVCLWYLLTLCFSVVSSHLLSLCVIFSPFVSLWSSRLFLCVIFSPSVSQWIALCTCSSWLNVHSTADLWLLTVLLWILLALLEVCTGRSCWAVCGLRSVHSAQAFTVPDACTVDWQVCSH